MAHTTADVHTLSARTFRDYKAHKDGQIYDAYELVSRLAKSARKRIILIDNYIDESVLTLLDKRGDGVSAEIYTRQPGAQLQLDIRRHDSQYAPIPVHVLTRSHDRFLLLDDEVYHIGASLKDLGKRWFAIMKMQETGAEDIIRPLAWRENEHVNEPQTVNFRPES